MTTRVYLLRWLLLIFVAEKRVGEDENMTAIDPLANAKGVVRLCELCQKPAYIQCSDCRLTFYWSVRAPSEQKKIKYFNFNFEFMRRVHTCEAVDGVSPAEMYRVAPKNWHNIFVLLNLSNIKRFSKLYYCQNQEKLSHLCEDRRALNEITSWRHFTSMYINNGHNGVGPSGPVNRAGIWKNALRCLTCMTKQTYCFVLVNKN